MFSTRITSVLALTSLSLLCAPSGNVNEPEKADLSAKNALATEIQALVSDKRVELKNRLTTLKSVWLSPEAPELPRRIAFQGLLTLAQELDESSLELRTIKEELLGHVKRSARDLIVAADTPQELRALMLREVGLLYQTGGREGADELLRLYRRRSDVPWLRDPRLQASLLLTCARAGCTELAVECKELAVQQSAAHDLRKAALLSLAEYAAPDCLALLQRVAVSGGEPYTLRGASVRALAGIESVSMRAVLLDCLREIPSTGDIDLDLQEFLGVVFHHLADIPPDEEIKPLLARCAGRLIAGSGPEYRLLLLRSAWGDVSVLPETAELAVSCTDEAYRGLFVRAILARGGSVELKRVLSDASVVLSASFIEGLKLLDINRAEAVKPELRAALQLAPREGLAKLLSALGDRDAVEPLHQALLRADRTDRLWILRTLVELKDLESIDLLLRELLRGSCSRQDTLSAYRSVATSVAGLADEVEKSVYVKRLAASATAANSEESSAFLHQGATEALAAIRSVDALEALVELSSADNSSLRLFSLAARAQCSDGRVEGELMRLAEAPETRHFGLVWKALTYCSSSASRRFLFTHAQNAPFEPLNYALHAWTLRQREDPTFASRLGISLVLDGSTKSAVWGMVNYAAALKGASNPAFHIQNPFCVRPNTLWRLVASAQSTTFDVRPLAAVIVGTEDENDAFGRAELAIRPLLDAGYMVRFSHVSQDFKTLRSTEDGLLERLRWATFATPEGKPRKQLDYLMFILHGAQGDAVLGAKTRTRSERGRRLDLSDEQLLIREGARALLKPGARGALVACWSAESALVTADQSQAPLSNLAQMMRRIWPQAAKGGFIAPRTAVRIEQLNVKANTMWEAKAEARY
jgi:hypothetical protein